MGVPKDKQLKLKKREGKRLKSQEKRRDGEREENWKYEKGGLKDRRMERRLTSKLSQILTTISSSQRRN